MAKKPVKSTVVTKAKPKGAKAKAPAKEPMTMLKYLTATYKGKFKAITGTKALHDANQVRHWISTGVLPIDIAISPGALGLPGGRVITLSAWSSHGKTLLALLIAAAFQAAGGAVHYIEPEDTLTSDFVEAMGVKMDDTFFQPDPKQFDNSIEDCFDYIEKTAGFHMKHEPQRPVLYVIDSISDLVCKKMIEEGYEDVTKYGPLEARIHRNGTKKLKAFIKQSKITILAVSHLIMQISMDAKAPIVGDKEITTGGRAWEFRSALHIRMKPAAGAGRLQYAADAKVGDRVYEQAGTQLEICCKKSKLGPPFHKAYVDFFFETSDEHEMGVDIDGSWFIWLRDRELVWRFKAKEKDTKEAKALQAAKAWEIQLDSGCRQFVGMTGWRKLMADPEFRKETAKFMMDRKSTYAVRDEVEREKAEERGEKMKELKKMQTAEDAREGASDADTDEEIGTLEDDAPEFEDEEEEKDETSDVEAAEGEVAADEE